MFISFSGIEKYSGIISMLLVFSFFIPWIFHFGSLVSWLHHMPSWAYFISVHDLSVKFPLSVFGFESASYPLLLYTGAASSSISYSMVSSLGTIFIALCFKSGWCQTRCAPENATHLSFCLHTLMHIIHDMFHRWRSEDNLWTLVITLHHVCPRGWTQGIRQQQVPLSSGPPHQPKILFFKNLVVYKGENIFLYVEIMGIFFNLLLLFISEAIVGSHGDM